MSCLPQHTLRQLYLILLIITVIIQSSVCYAEECNVRTAICHQIKPVSLCVLQHIHSRLAPCAPFRLLGYSFGALLALELALKLEAEGREGKLYLVDSAPDFLKALLTQSMASNEDEFQTSVICALFILTASHEATPEAVSKVYHEKSFKSYE